MVKWFSQKLLNWSNKNSKEPWASFEVNGFEPDGRIKVNFNWNDEFIKKIHAMGFQAETEDDSVQLFFYASSMRPTALDSVDIDEAVSAEHPNLASDTNILKQ
jgi:hypothetical protein